jgi:hypothetical protein
MMPTTENTLMNPDRQTVSLRIAGSWATAEAIGQKRPIAAWSRYPSLFPRFSGRAGYTQ